jgi:diguanylate cyclase (GGDEF)-like protein/PAS domain S-box-containing protein
MENKTLNKKKVKAAKKVTPPLKKSLLLKKKKNEKTGKKKSGLSNAADSLKRSVVKTLNNKDAERYNDFLENIQDGCFELDLSGNFTFFNSSLCRILGYSSEEIMGMNYRLYTDKETSKKALKVYDKVYKTGKPVKKFSWQVTRKDNEKIYVEGSISLRKDSSGRPEGFIGIVNDITGRRQTEKALRESKQRFKTQYHGSPIPTFTWQKIGSDFVLLECNAAGLAVTGANIKNYINRTAQEIYHDQQDVLHDIQKCFEEKTIIKKELQSKHFMPGRYVVATYAFVPDDLVMVHLEDITERKKAEEALKQSENFLNTLLNSIPIPVFYKNRAGQYMGFNKAYETFFGATKEKLIGKTVFDISPPELAKIYYDKDNELFESVGEQQYESQVKNTSGATRDVIFNKAVLTDSNEDVTGLIGVIYDITERKQAEIALRKSEELYTKLVNAIPDIIVRTDLDGKIIFVNNYTMLMSGYSWEEIEGRNLLEFLSPEEHERVIHDVQLMIERPRGPKEYSFIKKDGTIIPIEVNGDTLRNEDGTPFELVNVCRDISERKRTEMVLRENEERLRGITSNMPGIIYRFYAKDNGEFGVSYANGRLTEFFGGLRNPDEMFPIFLSNVHEEDRERFIKSIETAVKKGTPWNFIGRMHTHFGYMIWFQGMSTPTRYEDKMVFDGIILDITERKQAEEKFHKVFMTAPDCIVITRLIDGLIIDVNKGYEDVVGWKSENVIGKKTTEPPYRFWVNLSARDLMVADLKAGRDILHRESDFWRSDGSIRKGIYSARLIDVAGQECLVFVLQDITEQKNMQEALRQSEEKYRSILENIQEAYFEVDPTGNFTFFNDSLCRLTGYSRQELACANYSQFSDKETLEDVLKAFKKIYKTGEPNEGLDWLIVRKDGTKRYIEATISLKKDSSGDPIGFKGIIRDITERKHIEQALKDMATHDALTGLPNRLMFNQLLNHAIQSARRYQRQFAVFFIDLDRFKIINDTMGHEAGDQLLQEIANRFRQSLRAVDVVSRLGGDEFIILVEEVNELNQIATLAQKILASTIKPVLIMDKECRVTASIGISIFPTDGEDDQTLIKNADIAMYFAKEEGKNNYQFYSKDIKTLSTERMSIETNLRFALERKEFFLDYQARLDFKTGMITGVEALLRWENPYLGSVTPTRFIPVAEETGLIVSIGKWVLKTACAQNVIWQSQGLPPVRISVNLSLRQLMDDNLIEDITAILKEFGMAPDLLELEISESMLMHNPAHMIAILTKIKKMGVRLAVDNFGTGYSSLAQISHFPVDTLKVDRSFIRNISLDSEDKAIIEAIINMGKHLSLTVVAEGVETQVQDDFLRKLICDEMQGYYFSKPVAPDQFADLLRTNNNSLQKQIR